jgi:hypothetical protein
MFKLYVLLAKLGFFRYDGIVQQTPAWMPKALVRYPDGYVSRPMAVGNALDYQRLGGGELLPPDSSADE